MLKKRPRAAHRLARITKDGPHNHSQHPINGSLWPMAEWAALVVDKRFEANDIAALAGVGLRQFERLFQARLGKSPSTWIRGLRCARAAELVGQGWRTKEVARHLGFASGSHLCHEFRKVYQVSPQSHAQAARARGGGLDVGSVTPAGEMSP
jgi:transcriptional regulator GlxA family with amidase domain